MASVTFDNATRLYPGGTRPAVDKLNLEVGDGAGVLRTRADELWAQCR